MSFRFKQFAPKIPSTLVLHVYEEVFYRAVIEVDENLSPHKVIVEVLTTQRDSKEPSGALHPLKLVSFDFQSLKDFMNIIFSCVLFDILIWLMTRQMLNNCFSQ